MRLKQLKGDLELTAEDWERALTPETRQLMAATPNVSVAIGSDYAFRCACCSEIEGRAVYYQLVKKITGAVGSGETDPASIKSVKGIIEVKRLGFEPDNSSLLHVTRDGPVCDHCYDTVYTK